MRSYFNQFVTIGILSLWLTLTGCSGQSSDEQSNSQNSGQNSGQASGPASDVLVTVGEQTITSADLDAAVVRTMGEYGALQLSPEGRQKVLESLVMAKTMAIAQSSQMDASELAAVERNVTAYRDELLTKAYLKNNVTPAPVSQQMVKDYYNKYPEQFGGKTVRHYEIVKVMVKQQSNLKNQLVEQLADFKQLKDWKGEVINRKQNGDALQYARGAADGSMLTEQFAQVVNTLEQNQVSPVYFFEGYPSIIRVTRIINTPPKPLSEVSEEIRKTLLPVQLKQAIKQAANELSTTIKVNYQVPNE